MKTMKSPYACALAICLSALLGIPPMFWLRRTPRAEGGRSFAGNSSGEHCPRQQDYIGIGEKTVVDWADVCEHQAGAAHVSHWMTVRC